MHDLIKRIRVKRRGRSRFLALHRRSYRAIIARYAYNIIGICRSAAQRFRKPRRIASVRAHSCKHLVSQDDTRERT